MLPSKKSPANSIAYFSSTFLLSHRPLKILFHPCVLSRKQIDGNLKVPGQENVRTRINYLYTSPHVFPNRLFQFLSNLTQYLVALMISHCFPPPTFVHNCNVAPLLRLSFGYRRIVGNPSFIALAILLKVCSQFNLYCLISQTVFNIQGFL